MPKVEREHGILLDMNYYYSPPAWVGLRQGYMTGSSLPMPYADLDGTPLGVYQAATHVVNTNGRYQRAGLDVLLQRAVGAEQFVGIIGTHVDFVDRVAGQIMRAAIDKGVPLVTAEQVLQWTAGRDSSGFHDVRWNGAELSFSVRSAARPSQLVGMLPRQAGRKRLRQLQMGTRVIATTVRRFKGLDYITFPAQTGTYRAEYR